MPKPDIRINRSMYLTILLLLLFIGAVGLVLTWPVTAFIKSSAISLIIAYFIILLINNVLMWGNRVIIGVSWQDKCWLLHKKYGNVTASLLGDSVITPWVIVLRFKVPGKWLSSSCVIFKDAIPREDFRQLRLELRR